MSRDEIWYHLRWQMISDIKLKLIMSGVKKKNDSKSVLVA